MSWDNASLAMDNFTLASLMGTIGGNDTGSSEHAQANLVASPISKGTSKGKMNGGMFWGEGDWGCGSDDWGGQMASMMGMMGNSGPSFDPMSMMATINGAMGDSGPSFDPRSMMTTMNGGMGDSGPSFDPRSMMTTMNGGMGGFAGPGVGSLGKGSKAAKPGDWICPSCGDLVFAKKSVCSMCGCGPSIVSTGGAAPVQFDASAGGKASSKGGKSGKPGDWNCLQCGSLNFSARTECKACGAPIGAAARIGMRPGDWICPNCGDLVFASKSQCKMCGTPKPVELGFQSFRASPY